MSPGTGPSTSEGPPATDLLGQLADLLSGPTPRLLIIQGPPGAGKSSLLRALATRLRGPRVYVAYRALTPVPGAAPEESGDHLRVSLLLMDPDRSGGEGPDFSMGVPVAFAPTGAQGNDVYPPALAAAIEGLAAAGGGCVIVDSWDRGTEELFRTATRTEEPGTRLTATVGVLRERLGRLPVHTALALYTEADASMNSLADEVVALGHEELDHTDIRVLGLTKATRPAGLGPKMLFSVEGGFYCPRPDSGAPAVRAYAIDPAPGTDPTHAWPGSNPYARAFGRLRFHGFTAIELFDDPPDTTVDALVLPMMTAALAGGGRVVWVPSPSTYPARMLAALAGSLPAERISEGLRVLSASGADPALSEFPNVLIANRRSPRETREMRAAIAPPVEPLFPEAYQFLRDRPGDGTSLFVLSMDGLRAMSTVSGNAYDPATFPLVVGRYVRLSHFHGIGWARAGDPFLPNLLPGADTHLRIHQRYGHSVITGLRPRTPAYLMDRRSPTTGYELVSLA